MTPEIITQFGIGFAIAIYLIQQGVMLFKYVLSKYNPPDEPTQQQTLAKISGNDLAHIYKGIEKQIEQHDKQIEVLIQIKTILDCRLK